VDSSMRGEGELGVSTRGTRQVSAGLGPGKELERGDLVVLRGLGGRGTALIAVKLGDALTVAGRFG
jgi:hypothetical protein